MSSLQSTSITFQLKNSDPETVLATCPVIELGSDKRLSIECDIDNGVDGVAPTDAPGGSFRLYFSGDRLGTFKRCTLAETGTAGNMSLADIAPNGNAVVAAYANFSGCPGRYAKVLYVYGGSGQTARCRLRLTVGTL